MYASVRAHNNTAINRAGLCGSSGRFGFGVFIRNSQCRSERPAVAFGVAVSPKTDRRDWHEDTVGGGTLQAKSEQRAAEMKPQPWIVSILD